MGASDVANPFVLIRPWPHEYVAWEQGQFHHPLAPLPATKDFAFRQVRNNQFLLQHAFHGALMATSGPQHQPRVNSGRAHVYQPECVADKLVGMFTNGQDRMTAQPRRARRLNGPFPTPLA